MPSFALQTGFHGDQETVLEGGHWGLEICIARYSWPHGSHDQIPPESHVSSASCNAAEILILVATVYDKEPC